MNTTSKWLKTMVTSLLVTVAMVLPMSTVGDSSIPSVLGFEGVEMIVHDDGSVQMLFDVYVNNSANGDGAFFTMEYNPEYLVPSDFDTNEKISGGSGGYVQTDEFFQVAEDLYEKGNPFKKEIVTDLINNTTVNYATWNDTQATITMVLIVDHETLKSQSIVYIDGIAHDRYPEDDLHLIHHGFNDEPAFIYDAGTAHEDRVVLGRISFRVTDNTKLPEIIKYFNRVDVTTPDEPTVTVGEKTHMLINLKNDGNTSSTSGLRTDWGVAYFGDPNDPTNDTNNKRNWAQQDYSNVSDAGKVISRFTFNFPKTVISVRAAESELTINAYQAYTYGDMGDLAIALGKYSPMVTVTYADGTKENHVFQWDKTALNDYTVKYRNADGTLGAPVTDDAYKLTRTGGDYYITQKYVYEDGSGNPVAFPVPVDVTMTVTPIKLVEVTATDLTRTYALSKVLEQVETGADLNLPEYARLVTDVVPGGVSMVMEISGWKPVYGTWPVASGTVTSDNILMNYIWGDSTGSVYWPDNDDAASTGSLTAAKHVGAYFFEMAADYSATAAAKPGFTKGEITAKYPWLTVPNDSYAMPKPVRYIVDDSSTTLTPAENYAVTYVSTEIAGNGHPTLTLNVANTTGDKKMEESSQFRVWLPNGQELGTGMSSTDISAGTSPAFEVKNWFDHDSTPAGDEVDGDDVDGFYETARMDKESTENYTFDLSTNPGDTTTAPDDDNAAEREVLRRYINLGGWFYVSVNEDPANNYWSEPIPVYVPPRVNLYTESKFYDFSGDNNGLFSWIFSPGLGTTVTMPQGTYTGLVLDASGNPVLDDGGNTTTGEIEYGYTTTYDGNTGAEPGMNYTFAIEPDAAGGWTQSLSTSGTVTTTTYGANDFKNEATYTAYGTVNQPTDANGDGVTDNGTSAVNHTATILTDQTAQTAPTEGLVLKCITPNANVLYDADGNNVTLATYDTQTEGYTVRQDYVFTLTNTGTTDIYGIGIDTITDGYMDGKNDGGGGHFELLLPPTAFLRAGETTTFVLTYVYDLRAKGDDPLVYRDTLHVTTAAHPEGVIDFDAQFQVASDRIHKVTVVTIPSDDSLGTAGVIVGEVTDTSGSTTMSYTPASTAYVTGETVFVVVRPVDEYTEIVTIVDASGNTVSDKTGGSSSGEDYTYPGPAILADGTRVYYFDMPANDVTVTVRFQEDLLSKLRLQDLVDYSGSGYIEGESAFPAGFRAKPGEYGGNLSYTAEQDYIHRVWQKAFTDQELADAATVLANANASTGAGVSGSVGDDDKLYLMNMARGKAGVYAFDPSVDLYMVVIPYDAEFSQVEATIRELADHDLDNDKDKTVDNFDIEITVQMVWFSDWNEVTGVPDPVNEPKDLNAQPATGYTGELGTTYTGTGSTTHVSKVFESPEPGDSDYVRITLSAKDSDGNTQYRHYYLEIHRTDKSFDQVLGYGNSPFGMIMNDSKLIDKTTDLDDPANLTEARRAAAKQAFIDAGYTFVGVGDQFVPEVVKDNKMNVSTGADGRAAVYWREAWAANGSLYEPESGTGVNNASVYFDDRAAAGLDTDPYGYFIDDPYRLYNLDLYEYSLFAIMGQSLTDPGLLSVKDSSGRPVDVTKARVECTVTLLDTTGAKQIERFSGTEEVTLSMGTSGFKNKLYTEWAVQTTGTTDPGGNPVTVPVDNIRPGRYVMEYVYLDYDGVTELKVTRPFVILAPLGDVNADLTVDNIEMATTTGTKDKTNDEYLVENRVTDPLGWFAGTASYNGGSNMYSFANIFKYRVCDVNNDRNVNNIDANELEAYAATAATRESYPLFYLTTDYAK